MATCGMLPSWPDAMRIFYQLPLRWTPGWWIQEMKAFVPKHFDDFVAFNEQIC